MCRHKHQTPATSGNRLNDHQQPTRHIAVLGIDGSGKSTIARALAQQLSMKGIVCMVSDRLSLYHLGEELVPPPILPERIRPTINSFCRRAGSLRRYKLPKLAELFLRDASCRHYRDAILSGFVIMDGSPLLNMIAWASLYRKQVLSEQQSASAIGILSGRFRPETRTDSGLGDIPELRTICRLRLNRLAIPDTALFLDLPANIAMARIQSRGQAIQAHETSDRLARLREAYLRVCHAAARDWNVRFHQVDAERPLEAVRETCLQSIH